MAVRDPAVLYAAQSVRIQAADSEMGETKLDRRLWYVYGKATSAPSDKNIFSILPGRIHVLLSAASRLSLTAAVPLRLLLLQPDLQIQVFTLFTRRFVGIVQIP